MTGLSYVLAGCGFAAVFRSRGRGVVGVLERGMWVPTEHLLQYRGKTTGKFLIELVVRRISRLLTYC